MYPVSEQYRQKIQQPARQFAGRVLIPKLTATFTRNSIAYKSDGTQVPANTPRFEQGRFGKAIMVEEETTNLLSNPGFESGDTGWTKTNATIENVAGWQGSWRGRMALTGSEDDHARLFQSVAVTAGQSYTLSAYAKRLSGGTPVTYLIIQWKNSDGAAISQDLSPNLAPSITEGWERFSLTATAPTDAESAAVYCYVSKGAAVDIVWDAVQFENKPYATSFIDGTRFREILNIPTAGVLNPQEGTISVWVYVNNYLKTDYGTTKQIFWWSSATGRISLGWNVGGRWYAVTGNGTNNRTVSIVDTLSVGWHLFTMRWSATELALLIDGGAQKATAPNPYLPSNVSGSASIGHRGSSGYVNTLIDDLRISNRAKTDEEILETYGRGL